MKRYFSSVETHPPAKKSNPDPKCMDNGNDAWLEYRNVDGTLFMFYFHRKNSDVMKLYNTPEALQLPSLLIKDSPSELNDYGSHLSNTSAKEIEVAIVYVIEKALCEEIRNSNNWSIMIDETNSITDEKHLAIVSRHISHNGLKLENILHFGSDGAATLIGTKTGSFRRMQNLKMIQETLEEQIPQLAILNIINTRWLSMSNSVKNLHQILNSTGICHLYKISCRFNVYIDEIVSFADIKIHLDTTYDAITAQFIGFDGSYGTHLQKYVQDYNILSENLPSFIKSFSEAIINSIKSRFPQSDLYHSFRIFDPKLLPIKENELGNYGNDDIKKLSDYYGVDKMDDEGNIVEKIINSDNVKQEWKVAKYYINKLKVEMQQEDGNIF
ncbi:unnamed protein product [Rhizophagus irregularis]|uniref:DUF4371 domain-containing protein n=1 Tax=Rhizophagus irregularis TaxID=588596 RepID=A0A915Z676_9GLOM|nr:unnamed protein product [Rhizophagus irregularis]